MSRDGHEPKPCPHLAPLDPDLWPGSDRTPAPSTHQGDLSIFFGSLISRWTPRTHVSRCLLILAYTHALWGCVHLSLSKHWSVSLEARHRLSCRRHSASLLSVTNPHLGLVTRHIRSENIKLFKGHPLSCHSPYTFPLSSFLDLPELPVYEPFLLSFCSGRDQTLRLGAKFSTTEPYTWAWPSC